MYQKSPDLVVEYKVFKLREDISAEGRRKVTPYL